MERVMAPKTDVKKVDLESLVLKHGAHRAPSNGLTDACVMEAVAYLAGEKWSNSPECASPVLGAFLRAWNDQLPDDDRQQLKQYIPRLVGSKGSKAQEDERAWMAMDWLVRDYTPVWLRAAKLDAQADLIAALPEFKRGMDVPSVRLTIEAVRKDAAAAWTAAWAAAWTAARAAAGDAAWTAAWAAAGDAAGDAAGPSVVECQQSAHRLVDRMLAVTGS